MATTDDPTDPRLGRGIDEQGGGGQNEAYLVLSEAERAQGYVRPFRTSYVHLVCGVQTSMAPAIAQTYARQPDFYGSTYCAHCGGHFAIGADGEFVWDDGSKVGT